MEAHQEPAFRTPAAVGGPQTPPRADRPFWRPTKRSVAFAAVGLVAAFAAAATIFVSTGRLHQWLRSAALTQVNDVINGRVEIDYLSGSLLDGLTVHGLRVSKDGRSIFTADAVRVGYSLWPLLRRNYVFSEIHVTRPHVWLVQTDTGWNVTELMRPAPDANTNWHVTFERVAIEAGTVDLRLKDRAPVELQRLALGGRVALGSDGSTVDIRSSTFHEAASSTDAEFVGSISIAESGIALKDLRLSAPGIQLTGHVALNDARLSGLEIAARFARWDPVELGPYVPAAAVRLSTLSGDVTARGSMPAIETTWNLESRAVGRSTGRLTLDADDPGTLGVVGDLTVAGLDLGSLSARSDLDGVLDARASVDARLNLERLQASTGTVTIRTSRAILGPYRADRIDARTDLAGSRMRVTARVAAYRATATTVAVATISNDTIASVSATGMIQNVDLRRVPAMFKTPAVATDVSADYRLNWTPSEWTADLRARASSVETIRIGDTSTLHVDGRGSAVRISTHADVASVPAALLRIPPDLASSLEGILDAEVRIPDIARATDFSTLAGSGELTFTESDPESLNPARGLASVAFGAGLVDIYELDVKSPTAALLATGRLAIAADARDDSDLTFRADVPDMTRLATFGLRSAKGSGRADGHVTGPAGAWRVDGTFAGQELAYTERFRALTLNGEMDLRVPFDWRGTSGTVSVDGSFLVLAGNEIPKATLVVGRQDRRLDVRGRVEQPNRAIQFDSGIDLYPDYQQVHLREMTIAGAGSPWHLTSAENAIVRYSKAELAIDHLTLTRDNERVEMFGRLPFTDDLVSPSAELAVDVTGVNMGDLTLLVLGESRVTGTADGKVRIRGIQSSGTGSAEFALVHGRVADVPFNEIRVNAEMAGGAAEITANVTEPGGAVLDITGRVPVRAEAGPADLHVLGNGISLGLVQAVTTAVSEVRGQASVDLRASGPLSALAVKGTARLDAGAFLLAATGVRYQDVNAGVRFDEEWAYVDKASLTDSSGGILTLTGRTGMRAVDGARQVELAVQSDRIRVLSNNLGQVDVQADLRIAGRLTAPSVSGQVVASRARLEIDEIIKQFDAPPPLPAAVPSAAVATRDASLEAAPGPSVEKPAPAEPPPASTGWPGATVDVALSLPDNVVIRARDLRTGAGSMGLGDLNLTVGGNVTLRKQPDQSPVLVGAVEVVRGFYEFQGRRFDVARGSVLDFRGGEPSNPSLNVTGERLVSGVTARVQVTGTARRPVLALSSQPSLSESDVLALIVFNQPLNQLGTGEQVDLLERASDIALGAVASTLTDSIGRSLDVDLFEIRAPSSERPGELSVGTQVGQRVFVGFRQQFGSGDASRLSIEYRLTEALRMVTTVGQGGKDDGRRTDAARLDLVYTIKY